MALDVRILSGGSTFYLVNSSGTPTAGGAATGAGTTPYSVNAAEWTLSASPRQVIYSGGMPFRVGATPLYVGYENVVETINIGLRGSSADNTISLIRQLRQILNTALFSTPAVLYWQPHGASQPTHFEIYSADVQETGEWNNPAAGFVDVLCRVTWTRSLGGRLSSGETLLNAVSFANTGAGANIQSLGSSGSGELAYDGQPLNITIAPVSTSNEFRRIYLATVASRNYAAVSSGGGSTTASTSWTTFYSGATWSVAATRNVGLRARAMARLTTTSANAEIRAEARLAGANTTLWTGRAVGLSGITAPTLLDLGGFSLDMVRPALGITTYPIFFLYSVRSTNGSAVNVQMNYEEQLLAYTFAAADNVNAGTGGASVGVNGFQAQSGRVCLPWADPNIVEYSPAYGEPRDILTWAGTPPRYYPGAYLYLGWLTSGLTHSNLATATVTATQAPLYHTLRGNG